MELDFSFLRLAKRICKGRRHEFVDLSSDGTQTRYSRAFNAPSGW
jgi:hypothetical protein